MFTETFHTVSIIVSSEHPQFGQVRRRALDWQAGIYRVPVFAQGNLVDPGYHLVCPDNAFVPSEASQIFTKIPSTPAVKYPYDGVELPLVPGDPQPKENDADEHDRYHEGGEKDEGQVAGKCPHQGHYQSRDDYQDNQNNRQQHGETFKCHWCDRPELKR
ncbi:hypothetical protein C8Q76DRAFT_798731 [Earliella scabrosa]|nr:hypothetical protein C8Q76DRAFT_798731 [Earliella scabrosa]